MLTDDALWVDTYQNALFTSIAGTPANNLRNGRFVPPDSIYWEQSYHHIFETLPKTPRTCELLLARVVQRSLMTMIIPLVGEKENVTQSLSLFERFKQDFPKSTYLLILQQDIDQRFWFMQNRPKPPK